jgi:hypothetical protein
MCAFLQLNYLDITLCGQIVTALETGASDRDQQGGVEALVRCFGVLDDVLNSDASRELFTKLPAGAVKVRRQQAVVFHMRCR